MSERMCSALRVAREKLCVAQTDVPNGLHRMDLQRAIDAVDLVGTFHCREWSRYMEPPLPPDPDEAAP